MRRFRGRLLFAFVFVLLWVGACAQIRGALFAVQSALPKHPIALEAIEIAHDTACDDQPTTLAEARKKLTVPIVETRIVDGMQTAAPRMMLAPVGFSELPDDEQLAKIRHELVHYCQRRTIACFDQLWLFGSCDGPLDPRYVRSDLRWAFEVAAYRVSSGSVNLGRFRERYLLGDLDQASFAEQTRSALSHEAAHERVDRDHAQDPANDGGSEVDGAHSDDP